MTPGLNKSVAKPYAKGLYTSIAAAISEENAGSAELLSSKVSEISNELNNIRNMTLTIPYFKEYLLDPTVPKFLKKELVEKVFNGRLSQETVTFLNILLERKRMEVFEEVVWWFDELVEKERGFITSQVCSAVPISGLGQDILRLRLARKFGVKGVHFEFSMDMPKLIGGYILEVGGSQKYDCSIRSRLNKLESILKQ